MDYLLVTLIVWVIIHFSSYPSLARALRLRDKSSDPSQTRCGMPPGLRASPILFNHCVPLPTALCAKSTCTISRNPPRDASLNGVIPKQSRAFTSAPVLDEHPSEFHISALRHEMQRSRPVSWEFTFAPCSTRIRANSTCQPSDARYNGVELESSWAFTPTFCCLVSCCRLVVERGDGAATHRKR